MLPVPYSALETSNVALTLFAVMPLSATIACSATSPCPYSDTDVEPVLKSDCEKLPPAYHEPKYPPRLPSENELVPVFKIERMTTPCEIVLKSPG